MNHPPLDHFYGGWFDAKGANDPAGDDEPWAEFRPITEQIWAMEFGYA